MDVPEFLIPESELNHKLAEQQPRYVPIEGPSSSASLAEVVANENNYEDPSQGILQLKLSNGIRINARRTLNEPKAAMLRMVAAGGPPCLIARDVHAAYGKRDWPSCPDGVCIWSPELLQVLKAASFLQG